MALDPTTPIDSLTAASANGQTILCTSSYRTVTATITDFASLQEDADVAGQGGNGIGLFIANHPFADGDWWSVGNSIQTNGQTNQSTQPIQPNLVSTPPTAIIYGSPPTTVTGLNTTGTTGGTAVTFTTQVNSKLAKLGGAVFGAKRATPMYGVLVISVGVVIVVAGVVVYFVVWAKGKRRRNNGSSVKFY